MATQQRTAQNPRTPIHVERAQGPVVESPCRKQQEGKIAATPMLLQCEETSCSDPAVDGTRSRTPRSGRRRLRSRLYGRMSPPGANSRTDGSTEAIKRESAVQRPRMARGHPLHPAPQKSGPWASGPRRSNSCGPSHRPGLLTAAVRKISSLPGSLSAIRGVPRRSRRWCRFSQRQGPGRPWETAAGRTSPQKRNVALEPSHRGRQTHPAACWRGALEQSSWILFTKLTNPLYGTWEANCG